MYSLAPTPFSPLRRQPNPTALVVIVGLERFYYYSFPRYSSVSHCFNLSCGDCITKSKDNKAMFLTDVVGHILFPIVNQLVSSDYKLPIYGTRNIRPISRPYCIFQRFKGSGSMFVNLNLEVLAKKLVARSWQADFNGRLDGMSPNRDIKCLGYDFPQSCHRPI